MYAILETGGKQYKVEEGQVLRVERIKAEVGDQVEFDRILVVSRDGGDLLVGSPTVEGARAVGKVLEQGRGPKIRGFKYKAKVNYRRRYGHRQPYTKVLIEKIKV